MIGAIIGDIAGSKYEFDNTTDYDFDMFPRGCDYTDDTVCTVAVADAILSGKDYASTVHSWCRAYPYPKGSYGGSFARWVRSDDPQPYGSYGNGSAMRVSAVGHLFATENEVLTEAEKSAAITHNHREGIRGAVCVAHAVYALRQPNATLEDLRTLGERYYPGFAEKHFPVGVFDETCQGTVPLCLQIMLRSNGFEDAVRLGVSHGGDSDTIGAIVGAMAEALYGVPPRMVHAATQLLPQPMRDVLVRFASARQSIIS